MCRKSLGCNGETAENKEKKNSENQGKTPLEKQEFHLYFLATSSREMPFLMAMWERCSTAIPRLSFLNFCISGSLWKSFREATSLMNSNFPC